MKMVMESMEMDSGGTSSSRRRAGTETSVPRTWLRDGGGCVTFLVPWLILPKFLGQEGFYRRRVGVGGGLGQPDNRGARPPLGRAATMCGGPGPLLWPLSGVLKASWNYKILGVDFVQFREYFLTRISETKNSRKQELTLRHLVNRLVPKNA